MKDLLTFKFADRTYRRALEYHSACEQPVTAVFAHAAFHAGLAEGIDAPAKLLAQDHVLYQHGYTASELRELTTKRMLPLCCAIRKLQLNGFQIGMNEPARIR